MLIAGGPTDGLRDIAAVIRTDSEDGTASPLQGKKNPAVWIVIDEQQSRVTSTIQQDPDPTQAPLLTSACER